MKTIAFVGRAACYSPNSVEKDRAILSLVRSRLEQQGCTCLPVADEEAWTLSANGGQAGNHHTITGNIDAYVSMGRHDTTLLALQKLADSHTTVVNTPDSVRLCNHRSRQMRLLESHGVPVAPLTGSHGYWVKRGDGCAETAADVQYAADRQAASEAVRRLAARGVTDVDVRAHLVGDLLKFYGVRNTPFFRFFYPGDDGDWKFADEAQNGRPQHYPFSHDALHAMADRAAQLCGLGVYGGDCIVGADGQPVLIDLNDWPSFSRCRDEAASAIAHHIISKLNP